MKKIGIVLFLILGLGLGIYLVRGKNTSLPSLTTPSPVPSNDMSISYLRQKIYPGSDITIEKNLPDGSNFHQYLTYYYSDNLKIYALLTVPITEKPSNGFPVILFNHGYIAPKTYKTFPTVGQYATYYSVFSRNGYIVFKPDYRGNGISEGQPESAYYSSSFLVVDLIALASIKKYKDANPEKIGVWGHSMGGNITFKDLVIKPNDIKAAVIWNGVVGSYDDLVNNWSRKATFVLPPEDAALRNKHKKELIDQYGNPNQNSDFWKSIDPIFFLKDINSPLLLNVSEADNEVPPDFSKNLYQKLKELNKPVDINLYPGDNHNISKNFNKAMQSSLDFFDKYLK